MTKAKSKSKPKKRKEITEEDRIGIELKKLTNTKIFIDSEDTPDDYKEYPLIVVCKNNPKDYIYPIMIKLENSNIVRLSAMNNYVSTILRIVDLFSWCMDIRVKRRRQMEHIQTKRVLIVNEFVIEKIPACRT